MNIKLLNLGRQQ